MGGTGTDPVVDGLVKFQPASRQSHGCVGVFNELIAKQMGVLHELVPAAGTIAILDNSANPSSDLFQPHFGGASQSVCRISSLPIEGSERVVALAARVPILGWVQSRTSSLVSSRLLGCRAAGFRKLL